jgi:hypothetical protein
MKHACLFVTAMYLLLGSAIAQQKQGSVPCIRPFGKTSFAAVNTLTTANTVYTVGEDVPITLTARDSSGNVIKDYDKWVTSITLTLRNSHANSDSSDQTWNAYPDGYSWARINHNGSELAKISENEWSIPAGIFINGVAEISLVHSKADTGVYFELTPKQFALSQVSASYNFVPDTTENFLVALTSAVPDSQVVYLMRKYEIVVTPRDRYLNPSTEPIMAYFSARWPGEFVSGEGGLAGLYGGQVYIEGETNYFLGSNTVHGLADAQYIRVYAADNPDIYGITAPYEVRDHAPGPFRLFQPPDQTYLTLVGYSSPALFEWEASFDPYTNVLRSQRTGERASDVVRYKVVFVDSISLTSKIVIESDSLGSKNQYLTTHGVLLGIMEQLTGRRYGVVKTIWYVEASDGLYTTRNDSREYPPYPIGHRLTIEQWWFPPAVESLPGTASSISLHQNYPNPFAGTTGNSITNIRFETTEYGLVTLKVYDMLGHEVAVLADEILTPGTYMADFNAADLPAGVYHYTLVAGGKVITKSMVLGR